MTVPVTTVPAVGSTGQTGRVSPPPPSHTACRSGRWPATWSGPGDCCPVPRCRGRPDRRHHATVAVDGVDAAIFTHGATGGRGAYERSTTAVSPMCCGPSAAGGRGSP